MSVLGRTCPNPSYGNLIASAIDESIAHATEAVGDSPFIERHVESLRSLRDLVGSLSGDDSRVSTLFTAFTRSGGDSDLFELGENQQTLLATAGLNGDPLPTATELLEELVMAGTEDGFDRVEKLRSGESDADSRAAQAEVSKYREQAEATETENATLTKLLESEQIENARLTGQIEHLRRLIPNPGNGTELAPKVKQAKKKPVAATAGGSK